MRFKSLFLVCAFVLIFASGSHADEGATQAVDGFLKKKTQYTGTYDMYDADLDQVRNLRSLGKEDQVEDDVVLRKFRDISSGDIVTVAFTLEGEGSEVKVTGSNMKTIEAAAVKEPRKEAYTDEEIQEVMKGYVEKMSKFTGTYNLFDPKIEQMRKLELLELDPKVRRFGILSISTATFHDQTTDKKIKVDLQVENKKGELKIKKVLIK